MEKILAAIAAFFRKIREGPPHPVNMGNCDHCGRLFERPADIIDGEPAIECRHETGMTEYSMRYPGSWRVKITRYYTRGAITHHFLGFCEFCFLMKPGFVGLRFDRSYPIYYIWQNEQGEQYERYEYGQGPVNSQEE